MCPEGKLPMTAMMWLLGSPVIRPTSESVMCSIWGIFYNDKAIKSHLPFSVQSQMKCTNLHLTLTRASSPCSSSVSSFIWEDLGVPSTWWMELQTSLNMSSSCFSASTTTSFCKLSMCPTTGRVLYLKVCMRHWMLSWVSSSRCDSCWIMVGSLQSSRMAMSRPPTCGIEITLNARWLLHFPHTNVTKHRTWG